MHNKTDLLQSQAQVNRSS